MSKEAAMEIIRRANACYQIEDYEGYERAIAQGAKATGKSEGQFEDDVTDVRLFGEEGTG